jgi:hypothetical protein
MAVVLSAGAGLVAGLTHQQQAASDPRTDGAFVRWLEQSVEVPVEQLSAAMADHQLRRRGPAVLGASASLGGVPFRSLKLRLASSSRPSAAETRRGVFRAQAVVDYQLTVDDVLVGRRADAVFRLQRGTWRLVRVAPSGLDLWDHEPVQSVRTGNVLVLGRSGDSRLLALRTTAERARAAVARFWDARWPRTAVVVLPSDAELLNPMLGVQSSGDDQVAVTRWEAGPDGPVIRVLLNPTYYDQMSPLARKMVLRHEITHVAQDALPRSGVPSWLTEGLAEYVGYRGSGIGDEVIAARLFRQVRDEGAPTTLPDDDAFGFDRSQTQRRVAYESGWALVRMLAQRYGQETLVPFYASVAKGRGTTDRRLDRATERVFGTSFDVVVAQWRSWLEANA